MHRVGRSLMCPHCGGSETTWQSINMQGRVGYFFKQTDDPFEKVRCTCGTSFTALDAALDQSPFTRWAAVSTHVEIGAIDVTPGERGEVQLSAPFDIIGVIHITPQAPMYAVHEELYRDRMGIVTAPIRNSSASTTPPAVAWMIYGVRNENNLPVWWLHLFAAVSNAANGQFKTALVDYATAFEVYIDVFLRERLTAKYGANVAGHILDRTDKVAERVKVPLELATGSRFSTNTTLYQAWDTKVRKPRNDLAHGNRLPIGPLDVEDAHQAVCQAINWIEALP